MQSTTLKAGQALAMRARPTNLDDPVTKVVFIGPARSGKAKVRFADGELCGLEEWVPTRMLLCPWGERTAFQRDERRAAALREAYIAERDPIIEDAVSHVFEATGESGGFLLEWTGSPASAQRLWDRAGLPGRPDHHHLAFTDRTGTLWLPYVTAVQFAVAFAAAEPESVELHLKGWEDRLEAEGWQPGNRHSHDFLRTSRPAHALARQWAGAEEMQALRKELRRLQNLLSRAAADLRRAGDESDARRLERALSGS